ncbi:rRNA methyltransferase 3, mitochondrial [Drosophila tropicalis]|uniref:rRNA methyltransferase 3, mitochondrial n=1 Tax=Drosophila tropicalis TaxID=46794 RepID=UPI0035ABB02D
MLANILKRSLGRQINANCLSFYRLDSSSSSSKEIKDALDIEANLFENSSIQHEPVNTRDTLRKHNAGKSRASRGGDGGKAPVKTVPTAGVARVSLSNQRAVPQITPSTIIRDKDLDLEFVRLNLQDPLLSTLMITVRSRKRRDKNRQIIIEGRRLIREALSCGLKMQTLIFSQKEQLALLREEVALAQQKTNTKIYKVPQHDLKTWSTLVTPPGVMGIFERPSSRGFETAKNTATSSSLPITVVCDNIREPNNLGSIIRTCAALPCHQVVVIHGSCDPWESKALRGGCGGQFRLPIRDDIAWDDLALTIPPEAADNCHVYIAENNLEKLAEHTAIEYADMPAAPNGHQIVIIGGESHGVSSEAYSFMNLVGQNKGKCVYIPLAEGTDSLNVASALTLLLFELRRKLKQT